MRLVSLILVGDVGYEVVRRVLLSLCFPLVVPFLEDPIDLLEVIVDNVEFPTEPTI